jgi:uncharacterized YigZ family protein
VTESFRTVAGEGRAAFTVRGSHFLGRVAPADSVDAAEAFVERVRDAHPDATHHVPAYRVRANPLREWASDDGEPTGSAGDPALNVLEQRDLENVVAVVVREYGGTNLGVGGLARAYSRSVTDAVDDAGIVERRPVDRFRVTVDYDDSGTVRSVLDSAGVAYDASYAERAAFAVRAPVAEADALRDRLRSATSGRADIRADTGDDHAS